MFNTKPETTVQKIADQISLTADEASSMAHHGIDAWRQGQERMLEQAHRASVNTRDYIKEEPVKSVLMAAAAGAALMALATLATRSRSHP